MHLDVCRLRPPVAREAKNKLSADTKLTFLRHAVNMQRGFSGYVQNS